MTMATATDIESVMQDLDAAFSNKDGDAIFACLNKKIIPCLAQRGYLKIFTAVIVKMKDIYPQEAMNCLMGAIRSSKKHSTPQTSMISTFIQLAAEFGEKYPKDTLADLIDVVKMSAEGSLEQSAAISLMIRLTNRVGEDDAGLVLYALALAIKYSPQDSLRRGYVTDSLAKMAENHRKNRMMSTEEMLKISGSAMEYEPCLAVSSPVKIELSGTEIDASLEYGIALSEVLQMAPVAYSPPSIKDISRMGIEDLSQAIEMCEKGSAPQLAAAVAMVHLAGELGQNDPEQALGYLAQALHYVPANTDEQKMAVAAMMPLAEKIAKTDAAVSLHYLDIIAQRSAADSDTRKSAVALIKQMSPIDSRVATYLADRRVRVA